MAPILWSHVLLYISSNHLDERLTTEIPCDNNLFRPHLTTWCNIISWPLVATEGRLFKPRYHYSGRCIMHACSRAPRVLHRPLFPAWAHNPIVLRKGGSNWTILDHVSTRILSRWQQNLKSNPKFGSKSLTRLGACCIRESSGNTTTRTRAGPTLRLMWTVKAMVPSSYINKPNKKGEFKVGPAT